MTDSDSGNESGSEPITTCDDCGKELWWQPNKVGPLELCDGCVEPGDEGALVGGGSSE